MPRLRRRFLWLAAILTPVLLWGLVVGRLWHPYYLIGTFVQVVFQETMHLHGQVLDENGNALANVRVDLEFARFSFWRQFFTGKGTYPERVTAWTDDGGAFSVSRTRASYVNVSRLRLDDYIDSRDLIRAGSPRLEKRSWQIESLRSVSEKNPAILRMVSEAASGTSRSQTP